MFPLALGYSSAAITAFSLSTNVGVNSLHAAIPNEHSKRFQYYGGRATFPLRTYSAFRKILRNFEMPLLQALLYEAINEEYRESKYDKPL